MEHIYENIIRGVKVSTPIIGGAVGFCLGEINGLLTALIAFMVLDYLTGVIIAINIRKLSSKIGFLGISKKITIFFMIAIAHIIDTQILKMNDTLRMATMFFYLANEGISILENVGKLGLPIPKQLKNALKQLKEKGEEENE